MIMARGKTIKSRDKPEKTPLFSRQEEQVGASTASMWPCS